MAKPFPIRPYMGLSPYLEENALFFFGRGKVQDNIIANLKAKRLTLVFGPSGVGKSSVLNAGVAYKLRRVARKNLDETGKPELAVAVFQDWEDNPVAKLTACVQKAVREALEEPSEPMPESTSLADASQLWTERVGGDIFIILDQFEKYFLYHHYEDDKSGFAYELARMVNRHDLRVNFLISVRDDAFSKIERFQENIFDIFDNCLEIEHLDSAAARSAIKDPICQYNRLYGVGRKRISIGPGLVEEVLSQVRTGQLSLEEGGAGGLTKKESAREREASIETPFLQLVMTELWDKEINSGSTVLRLTTLNSMGGAERIVQTHLARVMEKLTEDEQDIAAGTFHFLVAPSGSKIALSASDLAESAELDRNKLVQLLEKLSSESCRILRAVGAAGAKSESRYEVFHDKLAKAILNWRRAYVQQRQAREADRRRLLISAIVILSVLALSFAAIARIQHQRAEAEKQALEQQIRADNEVKMRDRLRVSNLSNQTIARLYWNMVQSFDPEQLGKNPDSIINQLQETLEGYRQDRNQAGEGITLDNIAGIHYFLGNTSALLGKYERTREYYQRAEEHFQQARPLLENTLGPDHPEVATNLNDLAVIFVEQGKYKEAEPLFTQAVSILENVVEQPDDRYLADPLTNLAECYYSQGKYKEAEPLYNRVLEIRKNKLPTNNSDVAKSLYNLAWLYLKQGNYNGAEQRFNESLDIGQADPDLLLDTTLSLSGLGELYRERGKYADADRYLAEVRQIHEGLFAGNKKLIGWKEQLNADDSEKLGELYLDEGKYADAEQQFNAALRYWKNPLRESHPTRASILSSLAYVYYGQKRYGEAEKFFKGALEIQQKALPSSPKLARTLNGLAQLYAELGKYPEAEPLFAQARAIQEEAAPGHPYLAEILNNYASLLRKMNRETDTQQLEERARQIMADHKRENPDN